MAGCSFCGTVGRHWCLRPVVERTPPTRGREVETSWHEPCSACGGTGIHGHVEPSRAGDGLRLVQIAADGQGFVGLDSDGRVWTHIPGNGWLPLPMNVIEERRGP